MRYKLILIAIITSLLSTTYTFSSPKDLPEDSFKIIITNKLSRDINLASSSIKSNDTLEIAYDEPHFRFITLLLQISSYNYDLVEDYFTPSSNTPINYFIRVSPQEKPPYALNIKLCLQDTCSTKNSPYSDYQGFAHITYYEVDVLNAQNLLFLNKAHTIAVLSDG